MSTDDATPIVVVVEDDELLLKTLTTYFRMLEWRTRGFSTATAFLESLDWSPTIDCIVSDVRMDPMDGFELMAQLRSHSVQAPVIMMSQGAADALVRVGDTKHRSLAELRDLANDKGGIVELSDGVKVTLKTQVDKVDLMTDNVGAIL